VSYLRGALPILLFMFLLSSLPAMVSHRSAAADETEAPTVKSIPVRVAKATTATMTETSSYIGSLTPVQEVTISPSSPSNVVSILVQEGKTVAKGDPLFVLDDRIAKADVEVAQAKLVMAQGALRRAQELARAGNITQSRIEEVSSDSAITQANLSAAQARLDVLTLRAPFAGVVDIVKVSSGAFVQPGDALTKLQDETKIFVDFRVPQGFLPRLKLGQTFNFSSNAFGGRLFSGTISYMDPQVDRQTRSLAVRGVVANPTGVLQGGVSVRVDLDFAVHQNAVVVPTEALVPTMMGNDVFLVDNGRVRRVSVKVGVRAGGRVEILTGLQAGDTVVTIGQFELEDGTPVTLVGGTS